MHPYLSYKLLDRMTLIEGEVNSGIDFSEMYILSYPSDIEEDIISALDSRGELMNYPLEDQKLQDLTMYHFGYYFSRHELTENIEADLAGYLWIPSSAQQYLSNLRDSGEIILIDPNKDILVYIYYNE